MVDIVFGVFFAMTLITSAAVLLWGMIALAVEGYRETGILGVVAQLFSWAFMAGAMVIPFAFWINPVVAVGTLLVLATAGCLLMFYSMGEFS